MSEIKEEECKLNRIGQSICVCSFRHALTEWDTQLAFESGADEKDEWVFSFVALFIHDFAQMDRMIAHFHKMNMWTFPPKSMPMYSFFYLLLSLSLLSKNGSMYVFLKDQQDAKCF